MASITKTKSLNDHGIPSRNCPNLPVTVILEAEMRLAHVVGKTKATAAK